jgi:hypothetical protein
MAIHKVAALHCARHVAPDNAAPCRSARRYEHTRGGLVCGLTEPTAHSQRRDTKCSASTQRRSVTLAFRMTTNRTVKAELRRSRKRGASPGERCTRQRPLLRNWRLRILIPPKGGTGRQRSSSAGSVSRVGTNAGEPETPVVMTVVRG